MKLKRQKKSVIFQRSHKLFWLVGWLIVVVFLTQILGCSQKISNTSVAAANPKSEIIIAPGWDLGAKEGFDPTQGWNYYGNPLFFSTLLRRNANMELENDLAQSYSLSSDRKIWKIKIREDARFSDGVPLTAQDVAFTFEQTKKNAGLVDLTILEKAKVVSKYEVELYLKQPEFTFANKLATIGIVPKHRYNDEFSRNPIGSGAYKFVQWDETQQLIIEPNPYYYGKKPSIQRVVILFTTGDSVFAAAKAGKLQLAQVPQFLASQKLEGMDLYVTKNKGHYGLMFPTTLNRGEKTPKGYPIGNNITADKSIRQAVNYAIDRQLLVKDILQGYGTPAYGAVATGFPWEETTSIFADNDIKTAKKILADGGWEDSDGDGIVEKQEQKAEFILLYPANEPIRQGLALAVAKMLKPIGIKVNVEGKSWAEIDRRMHSNVVMYAMGTRNPQDLQFLYYSAMAKGDFQNPGYYSNPSVDRAIKNALNAVSEGEANSFWKQAQWDGKTGISVKGDAASAWLVNTDDTYFVSKCLNIGVKPNEINSWGRLIMDNLPDWKLVCS